MFSCSKCSVISVRTHRLSWAPHCCSGYPGSHLTDYIYMFLKCADDLDKTNTAAEPTVRCTEKWIKRGLNTMDVAFSLREETAEKFSRKKVRVYFCIFVDVLTHTCLTWVEWQWILEFRNHRTESQRVNTSCRPEHSETMARFKEQMEN